MWYKLKFPEVLIHLQQFIYWNLYIEHSFLIFPLAYTSIFMVSPSSISSKHNSTLYSSVTCLIILDSLRLCPKLMVELGTARGFSTRGRSWPGQIRLKSHKTIEKLTELYCYLLPWFLNQRKFCSSVMVSIFVDCSNHPSFTCLFCGLIFIYNIFGLDFFMN